jgi:hypothetical protein
MELRRRLTVIVVDKPTTTTACAFIIRHTITSIIITKRLATIVTIVALALVATLAIGLVLDIVVIVPVRVTCIAILAIESTILVA